MSQVRLYEIADQIRAVGNALVENGGELTPELEAELRAWQGALDFKAANAGLLVLELERQAEAAQAEAKRLAGLAAIRENAAARLKQYIQIAMESAGIQRVETDYCRLTLAKNPKRVVPFGDAEVASLPESRIFLREIPARLEWDKKAILAAWEKGELPNGIAEIKQDISLRIK